LRHDSSAARAAVNAVSGVMDRLVYVASCWACAANAALHAKAMSERRAVTEACCMLAPVTA
jgi:hypothetical protein